MDTIKLVEINRIIEEPNSPQIGYIRARILTGNQYLDISPIEYNLKYDSTQLVHKCESTPSNMEHIKEYMTKEYGIKQPCVIPTSVICIVDIEYDNGDKVSKLCNVIDTVTLVMTNKEYQEWISRHRNEQIELIIPKITPNSNNF